jgi:hypothetical protein
LELDISNWGKNPVHKTKYFKLENWKNPVQIDRGKGLNTYTNAEKKMVLNENFYSIGCFPLVKCDLSILTMCAMYRLSVHTSVIC